MATPQEVYQSIKDHIQSKDALKKAAINNGNDEEEVRLDGLIKRANDFLEDFKNEFNLK